MGQGDEFSRAFDQMRGDSAIQFSPVEMPEQPPPPDWMIQVFNWLGDLFAPLASLLVSGWPIMKWLLIVGAALLVVLLLWRAFGPGLAAKKGAASDADEWVPDQAAALSLLEDADRLAAEGRYDEATHLLLQRSVGQIAEARPDLIEPSSTAREIAAEPALPDRARAAFGVIAERVERSLFALRQLSQDDWLAARDAYAEFALTRQALAR